VVWRLRSGDRGVAAANKHLPDFNFFYYDECGPYDVNYYYDLANYLTVLLPISLLAQVSASDFYFAKQRQQYQQIVFLSSETQFEFHSYSINQSIKGSIPH